MGKKQRKKIGKPSSPQTGARSPSASGSSETKQRAMQAAQQAVGFLNRGDLQNAVKVIDHGLQLDPKNPDLLHLGGQAALYADDIDRGIELIRGAIKLAPKTALYHYNLGNALAARGDLDGALQCFRQTVRLEPKAADAYANLGIVFVKLDRQEEAEAAFSEAAKLQPNNPQTHLNLAICNMELLRPAKAASAIKRVEELVSDPDTTLLHKIGNIYRGLGRHLIAEDYYRKALEKEPDSAAIWYALGDVLSQAGEHERALEALETAREKGFNAGPLDLATARVHADRGEIDKAKELLASAFEASANSVLYVTRIAHLYTLVGDFESQEKCLHHVLEMDPDNVAAFAGLAFAPGRKLTDTEAGRLKKLADDKSVPSEARTSIGFALGNFYRYKKDYDQSFRFYRLGNHLKGYHFDRHAYALWLKQIEATFTKEYFAKRAGWGRDTRLPVLVVGMPRSGTTLTEQILSSHPDIFGAGEYGNVAGLCSVPGKPAPDLRRRLDLANTLSNDDVLAHADAYLAKMTALAGHGESFVTNKLPHNFQQLGLFALLFPEAPIVHIKRDPRDNLLSIYFQDFGGFHDYAYDLKTLGIYYRLYERLMAHWAEVIPNPVYQLQYEDLVADLSGKTAELADFIGVPLDEHMLRFWEQDRKVDTASKWQVRQPVYTSSVQRWKPYEKHLRPMLDALGPVDD